MLCSAYDISSIPVFSSCTRTFLHSHRPRLFAGENRFLSIICAMFSHSVCVLIYPADNEAERRDADSP